MFLCKNKHTSCHSCWSGLEKCPICVEAKLEKNNILGRKKLRNLKQGIKFLRENIQTVPFSEIIKEKQVPECGGANADVFKCKWGTKIVALKQLRLQAKDSQKEALFFEASIGVQLKHPNIVQVFGITEIEPNYFGIIMEWADLGTLAQNMSKMSEKEKTSASLCICDGLSYLHLNNLAHRDLTPFNILLFGNRSTAKISDFGTLRVIKSIQTNSAIGTLKFAAPELFQPKAKCGASVDIFSLSVILYQLFSGKDPYPGTLPEVVGAKHAKTFPSIPSDFPNELGSIINQCWVSEPDGRPTLTEIATSLKNYLNLVSTTTFQYFTFDL